MERRKHAGQHVSNATFPDQTSTHNSPPGSNQDDQRDGQRDGNESNDATISNSTASAIAANNAPRTELFSPDKSALRREYIDRAGRMRWMILLLSCFIMFGNYYAFDNPSALNRQLRAWMPSHSAAEFEYNLNLLYTVYSAPNVLLPFVVGHALDRFGSRFFLIGLSVLVCVGQLVFAAGVSARTWHWMFLGRVIFGLGGESLSVAQSRLVTEWFLGRELGLALGLNLSIARIGTVVNNNLSPRIAQVSQAHGGGVPGACWIGLVSCMFSLGCTLLCIAIDMLYRPTDAVAIVNGGGKMLRSRDVEDSFSSQESVTDGQSQIALLKAKNGSRKAAHPPADNLPSPSPAPAPAPGTLETNPAFIHPIFFLLLLLNFVSYGAVLCFNNIASAYLQTRYYAGNVLQANFAMSIPDMAAIFLVPAIGHLVDVTGCKLTTVTVGQMALVLGHVWLAMSSRPHWPYGPLSLLGIGYSTLLAIWSCAPYLVGANRHATAYGFLTASCNFSVTVLPIVVAALITADQSYFRVGIFFATLALIGFVICAAIHVLNRRYQLGLNSARVPSHVAALIHIASHDGLARQPAFESEPVAKSNQIADNTRGYK